MRIQSARCGVTARRVNMQHEAIDRQRGPTCWTCQSNDVSKWVKYWPRFAIRLTSGDISKASYWQECHEPSVWTNLPKCFLMLGPTNKFILNIKFKWVVNSHLVHVAEKWLFHSVCDCPCTIPCTTLPIGLTPVELWQKNGYVCQTCMHVSSSQDVCKPAPAEISS